MSAPSTDLGYLRLVLHGETDGVLLAEDRPATLATRAPEPREMRELLTLMAHRGARKVRLVGDDPAARQDLPELVRFVADVPGVEEVALTTRGPGIAGRMGELTGAGLRAINVDLDTLRPERYQQLTGRDGFAQVWSGIEEALDCGVAVKLNTVLQHGLNVDEVDDLVNLTARLPIEVRFVEWNACADRVAPPDRFVPTWEVMAMIKPALVPRLGDRYAGPALRFEIPGHRGGIGFIPNVTEHSCALCNRLGLTDHGEIQSCLFGHGLSLLRHLRSDGGLASVDGFVERIWRRKTLLAAKLSGWETLPAAALDAATT
jgi:cyclic pyranopterin phosphate synthase